MARLFTVMALTVAVGVWTEGCAKKSAIADKSSDDDAADGANSNDDDTGDDGKSPNPGDGDDTSSSLPDTTAPDVQSVTALANTIVRVVFSEGLDGTTVIAGNFHIQGVTDAVAVQQAQLASDGLTVTLTVAAGMQQGATYTLLVQGVSDTQGNAITSLTKDFVGRGVVVAELTGAPPAVTNVANITVQVGGSDIVAYQYALTGPSLTPSWSAETPIATTVSASDLADGAYTLAVVGKDSLGNWQDYDEPTNAQWLLDTVAPTASFASTPASVTDDASASFTVGGDGVVAFMEALDGGAWSAETAVGTAIAITDLDEGQHTLAIVGRDLAGNWQATTAATTYTWTVDFSAPIAVLGGLPADPTNVTSLDVTVGGSGVASFTYSLDGASSVAIADTATPIVVSGLGEGEHTLAVTGSDAAGNTQDTPTQYSWTVDTTPPTATLSGLPSDPTSATTTHILVSGDGVVTYRYRLDGGAWGGVYTVSTAIDLTGLIDGRHTLDVAGTDAAGNPQNTPTQYAWTVDTTPPTAVLTVTEPSTSPTRDTSFAAGVSGVDVTAYKYALDGGSWSTAIDVATAISASGVAEGTHMVQVIGRDAAGNWQSIAAATGASWTIDLTPPVATLNGVPAVLTDATSLDVSVGACVAYMWQLDGGAWSTETDVSVHVSASGLAEGSHTLEVVGRDAVGNWQATPAATVYTWTIDTTPPTVVLTNLPSDPSDDPVPSIGVSGAQIVAYEYSLDGGSWSTLFDVAIPITLTLSEGSHTLAVRGEDGAGNVQGAPTTASWTVDLTAPAVTLTGVPAVLTNVDSATITVSGTGVVQYSDRVDGETWSVPVAVATPIALTALADGPHTLDVVGVDAAGNWQQTPTSAGWTVDRTPPAAPATNDLAGSVGGLGVDATDLSLTFSWTNPADAAEVAIQVATDAAFSNVVFGGASGASLGTAQSYDYVVDTDDGAVYYARVRVRDAAQNWSAFGTASDGIHVVGGVSGKVESSNLTVISGATVSLQLADGTAVASTTSDTSGNFSLANVDIGTNRYKLVVSASGYNNASKGNISVGVGATTDIGIIYLVSTTAAPGTFSGTVVDANDGSVIRNATVTVIDWSGTTVTSATTNNSGAFTTVSAQPGTYTLIISKSGFFNLQVDNMIINGNNNVGRQALCQVLSEPQVRVVLLWGQNPHDLDLHVVGPTAKTVTSDGTPNNRFHVYWSGQKSFDENTGSYATNGDPGGSSSTTSLVQDDTSSYGPEAINLFGHGSGYAHGTYTFTVHDYSSTDWYAAPITLRIYDSQGLVQEIPIPNGGGSNYFWRVFKVDVEGASRGQRTITVNNTFAAAPNNSWFSKATMDW